MTRWALYNSAGNLKNNTDFLRRKCCSLESDVRKYKKIITEFERQQAKEEELRAKHPGLQELYTQYQVMLALVKEE